MRLFPILIIYRKYYGTKMMLALLGILYATVVSAPMLKAMGGSPAQQQYTRDHQNGIAVPSIGMAPAPTVRSRD